jgi:MFS family permease
MPDHRVKHFHGDGTKDEAKHEADPEAHRPSRSIFTVTDAFRRHYDETEPLRSDVEGRAVQLSDFARELLDTTMTVLPSVRLVSRPVALKGSDGLRGRAASLPVPRMAPVILPGPVKHSRNASAGYVDVMHAATSLRAQQPQPRMTDGEVDNWREVRIREGDGTQAITHKVSHQLAPRKAQKALPPSPTRLEDYDIRSKPYEYKTLCLLVISFAHLLVFAGLAQALAPARVISGTLSNDNAGSRAWFTVSYAIGAGTFILPAARFGEIFGCKRIFLIGCLGLGGASLAGGFAGLVREAGGSGTIYFIICRSVQGVGAAMLEPTGQAILSWIYAIPSGERNLVVCLHAATSPVGFVLGGLLASLFADKASWPFAFWSMAAMCTALAAVGLVVLPEREALGSGKALEVADDHSSLLIRMDLLGGLLGVAGPVLLVAGLVQAKSMTWSHACTYTLVILGAVLIGLAILNQLVSTHTTKSVHGLTPPAILVLGCVAAGWASFGILVFYSTEFVEVERKWSALTTSAGFAPGLVTALLATFLASRSCLTRIGLFWIILLAMLAFLASSILWATAPAAQAFYGNTLFGVLTGLAGMVLADPAIVLMDDSVPPEQQTVAGNLVAMLCHCSIAAAIALGATVEDAVSRPDKGQEQLTGIRAAQYLSVGLAGLAVLLATAFLLLQWSRGK